MIRISANYFIESTNLFIWIMLGRVTLCIAKRLEDWKLHAHTEPCCWLNLVIGPVEIMISR